MKNKDIQKQLRAEILTQLKKVNSVNAPNVYHLVKTQAGYKEIEERIITIVATEGITPSACIPYIENELNL